MPKSVLQAGIDLLKESGQTDFFGVDSADDLPIGNPDEEVTTGVDARDQLEAKVAAMRAHRTQIAVDGPFFALSNNVGQRAFGVEHYVLARGERGPGDGPERPGGRPVRGSGPRLDPPIGWSSAHGRSAHRRRGGCHGRERRTDASPRTPRSRRARPPPIRRPAPRADRSTGLAAAGRCSRCATPTSAAPGSAPGVGAAAGSRSSCWALVGLRLAARADDGTRRRLPAAAARSTRSC